MSGRSWNIWVSFRGSLGEVSASRLANEDGHNFWDGSVDVFLVDKPVLDVGQLEAVTVEVKGGNHWNVDKVRHFETFQFLKIKIIIYGFRCGYTSFVII